MRTLGWVLFIFNIAGLVFCIYQLQFELRIIYLIAAGLLLAQTIYNAKTIKIIKKYEIAQKMLAEATKKAGLAMAKIISGKKTN